MNKHDLRFQKAESAIRETYLALKKGNTHVRVKDLCEKAGINKTTFYSHYETIDHLQQQLRTEFVSQLLDTCPHIMEMLSDTRAFVQSIQHVFNKNRSMSELLYSNDFQTLLDDVESRMLEKYLCAGLDVDTEIAVRFCIGGAFRILALETDGRHVLKVSELAERVLSVETVRNNI